MNTCMHRHKQMHAKSVLSNPTHWISEIKTKTQEEKNALTQIHVYMWYTKIYSNKYYKH